MKYKTLTVITILLVLFLLWIIITAFFSEVPLYKPTKNDLDKNGFIIYNNVLTNDEIYKLNSLCTDNDYKKTKDVLLNHTRLNKLIKSIGPDYIFQDYVWIIKKSSVHTCHRDNNGDFFNEGQQHPSYTMLVYLEDMDKCLGVIPESHKNQYSYFIDFNGNLVNLPCNKGDVILFNANLIHVGTLNARDDNLRVQLKVTHKDDIDKLSYYQNFNKVLNKNNTMPMHIRKAQRNLSCMFPGFSNLTQSENIRTSRGTDNGVNIGVFQQWFSYLFYGDVNFYDLPNAF